MNYLSRIFEIYGGNEIGLQLEGLIFFLFLKIGFIFATLKAFGKTPCEIERLQNAEMGFANVSNQESDWLITLRSRINGGEGGGLGGLEICVKYNKRGGLEYPGGSENG